MDTYATKIAPIAYLNLQQMGNGLSLRNSGIDDVLR
jgi:hypothetical protein